MQTAQGRMHEKSDEEFARQLQAQGLFADLRINSVPVGIPMYPPARVSIPVGVPLHAPPRSSRFNNPPLPLPPQPVIATPSFPPKLVRTPSVTSVSLDDVLKIDEASAQKVLSGLASFSTLSSRRALLI